MRSTNLNFSGNIEEKIEGIENLILLFNRYLLKHLNAIKEIRKKIHSKNTEIVSDLKNLEKMYFEDLEEFKNVEFGSKKSLKKLERNCMKYFQSSKFLEKGHYIEIVEIDIFSIDSNERIGVVEDYLVQFKRNLEERHTNIYQSASNTLAKIINQNN